MSKSERDAVLLELTSKLFSAMLGEIIMDTAILSHEETTRSRAVCDICHTRCGQVHIPSSSTSGASAVTLQVPAASRAPSPSGGAIGSGAAGTSTPVSGKADGNVYLECLGCQRQIASNRYAPHLSSCMGFGTARRGVARNATTKTKLSANGTRSASPYVDSVNGNNSDDAKPTKGKGKARGVGRQSTVVEEDEPLSRKRPGSPQVPPSKKSKKKLNASPASRTSASGTIDVPRTPNQHHLGLPGSNPKIPSKLSTPSFVAPSKSRSASPQTDSSADTPIATVSTPSSSGASAQSPTLPAAGAIGRGGRKNGKAAVANGSAKRPQAALPSRPSPMPVVPVRRVPDPDYLIDVEGEETGSSSDTDSS